MSKGKAVENRTEELLAPIAEENGVEIYDVEYLKEGSDWYLSCLLYTSNSRVFPADKKG